MRPVLRARQKEEIALHVASARRMRKESCLTIDHVWQTYLAQSQRPDSSPGTLHSYQKSWNGFLAWLSRKHPELRNVSQLHEEIAVEYFNDIWNGNLSARTYNAYRQALKLIFKHIMPVAGLENNPFNKIIRKTGHSESRNEFTSDQVQAIFDGFQKGFYYTSEQEGLGPGRKRVRKLVTQEYHPLHKDEMFVLLNLCCWTGCRGQDGCLMKWENVDMEHQQITYVPQKTARKTAYRSVTLPIHPNLLDALRKAQAWHSGNLPGEDYIIPNVAHRYLECGASLSAQSIRNSKRRDEDDPLCDRAGDHREKALGTPGPEPESLQSAQFPAYVCVVLRECGGPAGCGCFNCRPRQHGNDPALCPYLR